MPEDCLSFTTPRQTLRLKLAGVHVSNSDLLT